MMGRRSVGMIKIVVISVVILAGGISFLGSDRSEKGTILAAAGEDLKILKSEVNSKAKFYSYKTGKTYMEVIAVKAKDGTIRTALNTCQVCYDSGRGFYTQEGNE